MIQGYFRLRTYGNEINTKGIIEKLEKGCGPIYSHEERSRYYNLAIGELAQSELVEGIVQLGSGVEGYKDEYSDIDLMVAAATMEEVESTRDFVRATLHGFHPLYLKEKQFSKDIFLLIALMENGLEFNVSIAPRELLSVRSPLWKVVHDRSGLVTEKMGKENERFVSQQVKYDVGFDLVFEFVYCALALKKELKRNNPIHALRMLEEMRRFTLIVQALNEGKKLHQFKAYETLNPSFQESYLSTFAGEATVPNITASAEKVKELFIKTLDESNVLFLDNELEQLLNKTK